MARQLTIQDYLIMQAENEKKLAEANKEIQILNGENYALKQKLDNAEKALRIIRHATNTTDIVWGYDE